MNNGRPKIEFDAAPLARARLVRRIRIVDLARQARTSVGTVCRVLNGQCPNSAALAPICEVLGVAVAQCFPEQPEANR